MNLNSLWFLSEMIIYKPELAVVSLGEEIIYEPELTVVSF